MRSTCDVSCGRRRVRRRRERARRCRSTVLGSEVRRHVARTPRPPFQEADRGAKSSPAIRWRVSGAIGVESDDVAIDRIIGRADRQPFVIGLPHVEPHAPNVVEEQSVGAPCRPVEIRTGLRAHRWSRPAHPTRAPPARRSRRSAARCGTVDRRLHGPRVSRVTTQDASSSDAPPSQAATPD